MTQTNDNAENATKDGLFKLATALTRRPGHINERKSANNSPITDYQNLNSMDDDDNDDIDTETNGDNKTPSNGGDNDTESKKGLLVPFDFEDKEPFDSPTNGYQSEHVLLYPNDPELYSSMSYVQRFRKWLYPVDTPIELQLFRVENIAIPYCYLLVGLLQGLSGPLINVLPLDLGASEAQQATVSSIRSIPASFKLLFGFWSDTMPIAGYRRKPYMLFGWSLASLSLMALLTFSNLNIPARNAGCFKSADNDATEAASAVDLEELGAPSIPFLSLCLLGFGTGFWFADVMGDSIVAEKAKLELPEHRGSLQSTCYACRFFGIMVAAPLSTYVYSAFGPYYVVLILCGMPLTILPLIYFLFEQQYAYVASVKDQCSEIWNTVCSRAVWQPMGFVYLYNIMQVGNAAWREYLVTVQHFTSCQLNLILIVAYVLLYFGVLAYKYYFITWSWRKVYILTTILNGVFSILQVLLIYGITFGLSPFLFTLGDDAFSEFISGIQFLPTTIMMVHLCPAGSEGASYAMFTTVHNSSLNLSGAISTILLNIWDVSKTAFQNEQFQGMINLTYLTTAIQVGAIVFVGLLPRYKEDLIALKNNTNFNSSKIGGTIFLTITFSSIAYAIFIGIMNIMDPGWNGES